GYCLFHAFGKRRAVVCGDIKDAVEILEQRKQHFFFSGEHIDRSVIFMFPGQGTQYAHMAWELYKDEPVFRRYLDMCAEMIEALSGIDLIEAIYPRRLRKRNGTRSETGDKDILTAETHIGQLALFAVEYALAQLWMSWGVRPRGMIGHSVGEYTAACLAGVFTLENALRVIIARGLLTQQIPEGRMVAVVMGEKKVRSFLGNNLWLAAINTPSLCVVSGTISAIHRLQGQLARRRIPCIPLKTMRAFHSGMLDAILAPFAKVMEQVPLNPPKIHFVSGVTGEWITADQAEDPGYWVKHLRQPVHFSNGVQELLREPNRILLEVGPGDTLKRLVKHHIQYEDRRRMFSSLRRGDEAESDTAFLLKTLGQVWVAGVLPDWVSFYGNENRRRIPLPTYPFERKRYWPDRKQELQKKDGPKKIPNESLLHHHPRPDLSAAFTPPSGEIEKVIAAVWEDLFEIRPIGRNDNFFELGGHSLNATILISRIHRELDVNIPLKEVFTHPTVDRLAAVVEKAGRDTHSAVEPVEKQNYYRLSSAQKRTYFLWQMDKGGTAYNMPVVRVVEGELDRGKCEKTFRTLIQRHESLRTSFHIVAGVPVQRVHRHAAFCIDYYHIELGEWGKKRAVSLPGRVNVPDTAKMIVDFIRPFDLSRVPLLRVGLVRLSRHRHLLLFDMHHIISDGTSMNIFVKDYMSIYGGETLAPLQLQYKDFAHWQWINKEKDSAKKQEAYWKKEFEGEVPILNLPVDYVRVRSAVRSVEGGSSDFEIGKPGTRGISKLAAAEGATLFMILLSFFNVLLAKLSGQEDIVVGSPIAGRRHVDIEHIIGMFVNTLAMRSYPAPGKSFKDFLGEVRERVLQDFENQDYQFEDLVEEAGGSLDRSRNPLFDVMFVLQNTGIPEMEVSGLKLKPFHFKSRTSKFDILLSVVEMGGLLHFRMQYRTRLFKEESIQRFIKYFKKIVTAVIRQPEIEISQIEIISEEEKQQVLHHFNRSEADYPRDKTLHRLFSEQAAKTPDSIAVTGKGRLYLTYGELDAKADGVAGILKGKGIKEDRITAIIMNRSGEMIIGMLAILKAGAAYLPIDPEFPRARVKFILEDSRAAAVLMQRHLYEATGTELRHFFAGDILPLETGVSGTGKTISPISRQDTCKPGNP
ncbi:MAG: acyltransferase domain-containing protein, partial [bacterium]|nr:acyltransferase domain-containing protein [bacterium]